MADSRLPPHDRIPGSLRNFASLVDVLRLRAAQQPHQAAFTFLADGETEAGRLTYGELDRRARALGEALQRLGLQDGNALLLFPAGLEFVTAFCGCLYAGAVAVPASPPRASREQPGLHAIARDARPRVVLTTSAIVARASPPGSRIPELEGVRWLATDDPDLGDAAAWNDPGARSGSLAFLQYTSGSTSAPKGVMVTHGNLLHNLEMIRQAFGQDEGSVILGWLPPYHDMGLIGNVLQPLYAGARCILMSPHAFLQRPLRWLAAVSLYRATTSGGPNFAYDLCVRRIGDAQRRHLDLSSWSVAFNGAEPVRADTLERFSAAFAPCGFRSEAFYPCYGLAEATLFVSGGDRTAQPRVLEVDAAALERHGVAVPEMGTCPRRLVACGRPWAGERVLVVDPETLAACPPGAVGEIWIDGENVTGGYWGNPEATARDFAARPSGSQPGPFLRTGDLGFVHEGELYVTGRIKDLIILYGRNHYPQDIEATVEACHPDLRPGGAAAFSLAVDGEERLALIAELDRRRGVTASPEAIAMAVRRAVAGAHAAQVHTLALLQSGALPRTTSGKVRRRESRIALLAGRLPVIARSVLEDTETFDGASRGEVLRREAARVLRIAPQDLPDDAPLTGLGLDSVGAFELGSALEETLGVAADWTALLEGADLRQVAAWIAAAPLSRRPQAESSLALPSITGEMPLSGGQRGLWLEHRLHPQSAAYNLAAAARLVGPLDLAAFEEAWRHLAVLHPVLRARFVERAGEPFQRWSEGPGLAIESRDAKSWGEAELERWLAAEAHRPFDLEQGPLVRVFLLARAPEEAVVLLVLHHIVVDFRSFEILVRDLRRCYGAARRRDGLPAAKSSPPGYAVFAARQRELLAGPRGEELWSFWSRHLAGGIPPLALPADHPRPAVLGYGGAAVAVRLSPGLTQRIAVAASAAGATPFALLLAAFGALLHRFTGADRIGVGAPAGGRTLPGTSEIVGYFVNTVVILIRVEGSEPWLRLVRQVRSGAAAALAHQDLPFPLVAERLQAMAGGSLQALFVHHRPLRPEAGALAGFALGEAGARLDLDGVAVESLPLEPRAARFDLELATSELDGGLCVQLRYRTELFERTTARRMLGQLEHLLASAAADPERPVAALDLLGAAERHQLLLEWKGPSAGEAFPPFCLHRAFAAQAAAAPERLALVCGEERIAYRELLDRVRRVAGALRSLGVGPEILVGVYLDRSVEMVVALLAVLTAGGAYLPLDPEYPPRRTEQILDDARAAVVITRSRLAGRLPATASRLLDVEEALASASGGVPDSPLSPGGLAYVIYTSGSTGRPKGIAIEHRNAAALLGWARDAFSAEEISGVLAATSICFDLSVFELFAPLCLGGCAILARHALELPSIPAVAPVRLLSTVPAAAAELARSGGIPPGVRTVVLAGEPLRAGLARRLHETGTVTRLLNLYGPSEDTTYSTGVEVLPGAERVTVGRPLAGRSACVLDRGLEPLPIGVPGELYLGGPGVARGYLGRPELTAERFVPDPFAPLPGRRLYRTGDVARVLAGGSLDLLGRVDHQVKVRGYRVEIGEIETVLLRHPAVRDAVVVALEAAGEKRLVAYVATGEPDGTEAPGLRAWLRERLPEPMVPSRFIAVPELPRTPNGKVDLAALPAPERALAAERSAPRNRIERLLAEIWAELLAVETVGIEDDFFELGGHSLTANRLAARLREELQIDVPLREVFELRTIAGMAAAVSRRLADGPRSAAPATFRHMPRAGDAFPLSWSQQQLWFLDQVQPGIAAYHIPAALRLRGSLSIAALGWSLEALIARHEALRTRFELRRDGPVQIVEAAPAVSLPVVDLAALTPDSRSCETERLTLAASRRPFDLGHAPLLRAALLRLSAGESVLVIVVHHIAADGHSLGVLVRELGLFYAAAVAGRRPQMPEPSVQQIDFVLWQRERLQGERLERLLGFWKQQLGGPCEALALLAGPSRPPVQTWRGARSPFVVPPPLAARVQALARQRGATPFMLLLTAFATLLHRYGGQDRVDVGAPASSRSERELADTVGLLLNTLVLRADFAGLPGFGTLADRMRETALAAYLHQELPFPLLVEALGPAPDLSRNPLFQVLFALHSEPPPALDLTGLVVEPFVFDPGTAQFDLALHLSGGGPLWRGWIEHNLDLVDPPSAQRLGGHLLVLLAAALERPDQPVAELPLLSPAERREIAAWNATDVPFPRDLCVHQLIEAQVDRTPEAAAVTCGGFALTYADLDRRANRLAHRLRCCGVGPGDAVGLYVERSLGMVVALLGILKAGAAYVPLPPAYPPERLSLMVEDAGLAVVVAQRGAAPPPSGTARIVELEADDSLPAGETERRPAVPPESLAYVMYTSGSTGRPKGVMVSHRNVVNLFAAMDARLGREAGVWLAVTSLSFDISVLELLWTLARGFHVVLRADPPWAVEGLATQVVAHGVTHLQCTPSLARMAAAEPGTLRALGCLRALLLGGETLPLDLARRLRDTLPGVAIYNLYGPTETTVWSAAERLDTVAETVPIGRPLANSYVHLLDLSSQPVAAGVGGEICIGGEGVARGYLGRPDLTAERFVPDAWSGEPGARLYRTGDLGWRRPDGPLELLGRADHQVKIRGHRIEPGEIEAVLAGHPAVRQAVVVARLEESGDVRLAAYAVPSGAEPPAVDELRAFLGERLPEILVPSAFTFLETLPLTPNGKVDRRALPVPASAPSPASQGALLTPVEELLAGLWADLLGVERVGAEESFFALGGHSLLATRVVARVGAACGVDLPLRVLFETPTVRALAAYVEAARQAGSGLAAPPLGITPRPKLLPLSFAQQRLRFLHQIDPANPFYNDGAVLELEGRLEVAALRCALGEVVRRHEVLRTAYPIVDDRPVQRIGRPAPVALPIVDLSALPAEVRRLEVRRQTAAEGRCPFDLDTGPVLRCVLLRLAAAEHLFLFSLHHIASDAWSGAILIREITAIYGAVCQALPSPLPPLPLQYADFACWQQRWLQGTVLEEHLAYWRQVLGGSPPALRLPTDRPRSSPPGHRGRRRKFLVPQDLSRSLRELSRREGATLFMTLLAAFGVLLRQATGQEEIVVGTAVANRGRVETEDLIGLFIEMLPLRVDLAGNPRFLDLLKDVREVALGAFAHQDFPLERLHGGLRRDGEGASPFRVAFGVRNAPFAELQVPGLAIRPVEIEQEAVRFDVTVWVSETPGGLEVAWTFSSDLFEEATIERMHGRYVALLGSIVAAPESRIGSLDSGADEEKERQAREDQAWRDLQAVKLLSLRRRPQAP